MLFKKLLIANRGEIACRIIKTAKKLNMSTVAVYSEIDANALHVKMADEHYCLGAAPSIESYLNAEKIIQIAQKTGAEAIHPGYGFLSEDPDFAELCYQNSIVFVGPSAAAIRTMGDKDLAKTTMSAAGVPIVPGYQGDMENLDNLNSALQSIGLPVLIKASAGGGGKGMRLVEELPQLNEAIAGATREAKASFGDGRIFIEKYLNHARHIEVQILFDQYGHGLYLFDRDCSIQRRHQKIIEEAPAPGLKDSTRKKMAKTALLAGSAIQYCNAGTIEFLVDENENFYFMEMNTRLQVEHPVTEMISGLDLVEWQLRIAHGEKINFNQRDLQAKGHAIEARLYAENPQKNFMPSAGLLKVFHLPEETFEVRVDSGFQSGDWVSIYYDPLLAKLVAWGKTRSESVKLLQLMLSKTAVLGIHSNEELLYRITSHPQFNQAQITTQFIPEHQEELLQCLPEPQPVILVFAIMSLISQQNFQLQQYRSQSQDVHSPWFISDGWRLGNRAARYLTIWSQEQHWRIKISQESGWYQLCWNQHDIKVEVISEKFPEFNLKIDSHFEQALIFTEKQSVNLFYQGSQWFFSLQKPVNDLLLSTNIESVSAPMPGTVIEIFVKEGQTIAQGDRLFILEAMKMEHVIKAAKAAQVSKIFYKKGDRVQEGASIMEFDQ